MVNSQLMSKSALEKEGQECRNSKKRVLISVENYMMIGLKKSSWLIENWRRWSVCSPIFIPWFGALRSFLSKQRQVRAPIKS